MFLKRIIQCRFDNPPLNEHPGVHLKYHSLILRCLPTGRTHHIVCCRDAPLGGQSPHRRPCFPGEYRPPDSPSLISLNMSLVGHDACTMIIIHACTYACDNSTCMYYAHDTCMYHDHSTCMYYSHSTCMYYDHST